MNYKKGKPKRRIWRKESHSLKFIGEWSRMLHKWWKKDIIDKKKLDIYD